MNGVVDNDDYDEDGITGFFKEDDELTSNKTKSKTVESKTLKRYILKTVYDKTVDETRKHLDFENVEKVIRDVENQFKSDDQFTEIGKGTKSHSCYRI